MAAAHGDGKEKDEKKAKDGIELGLYLSWVKTELDQENACLELPFTLVLLLSFAILALLHLKQENTFVVEKAWKFDIQENANFAWSHNFGHKTVHDVNSIADFWSWFRIGFLPLVVQHSWSFSESLDDSYAAANALTNSSAFDTSMLPGQWSLKFGHPPDEAYATVELPVRDDYLHYNRIVGGIRLRQERSEGSWESCKFPSSVSEAQMKAWLGKPCMPATPSYEITPEVGDAEAFFNPQHTEWLLPARDSLQDMQMKALDMEDGCSQLQEKREAKNASNGSVQCLCLSCADRAHDGLGGPLRPAPWFDERTQRVQIATVSYNQNYGLLSLITVNFFINRGGHIYKVIHAQSAYTSDFGGNIFEVATMILSDVVWFVMLTYVMVSELKEILAVVKASSAHWYVSIIQDYLAFWNAVDWISIVCAYCVLGLYARFFVVSGETNSMLAEIAQRDESQISRLESEAASAALFQVVEDTVSAESDFRFALMFYPIVVMLRLFKSFDAQPRLAVVTSTLKIAAPDMVHFFIVFLSVYFCMAMNGTLLFGQDVEQFATLDRSLITCFRAMLGEWDWETFQIVGKIYAGTWLWLYVLIVVVLLLNMLLAILMDAYAVVKGKAAEMVGLPQQISEMLRRRRQYLNKERVRLTDIWDSYSEVLGDERAMVSSKEWVTPEDVIKQVQGIPPKQAKRTLQNARSSLETGLQAPYTSSEFKEQLDLCNDRMRILREEAQKLRKGIAEARSCNDADLGKVMARTGLSPGIQETSMDIFNIMKDEVTGLSKQIKEVLDDEAGTWEDRQAKLCKQQRDILDSARECRTNLDVMEQNARRLAAGLEEQVARKKRRFNLSGAKTALGNALTGFASACGAPPSAIPEKVEISSV
eukprot:TRINITY_DN11438_c0_g1_i1.p1 TRINITY_DN11438_c0_g1~~TRINITY_DN11438_c0_g1_i1.p1  ORF type:complete len:876 (-),score=181.08 TRINITY_DN11438_c0_g1_i1:39-2666(-)